MRRRFATRTTAATGFAAAATSDSNVAISIGNGTATQRGFDDGTLVEHWGVPDRLAVLLQLGMFPPHTP